ncbi:unnamed protein product [Strongylus vulgaris]|uniref:Uncharacterized protein n=1 Tax=Strongylus vulgaris TaxID=40348 RepID=A0A3P7KK24_STRVU|nr:unnamed protein product [Strongylus vulgaris]
MTSLLQMRVMSRHVSSGLEMMKTAAQADSRHMRMFFILVCILLIVLTLSFLNYEKQIEIEQRRQNLESTISNFAQRVVAAANDPDAQVSVDVMKNYVEVSVFGKVKVTSVSNTLSVAFFNHRTDNVGERDYFDSHTLTNSLKPLIVKNLNSKEFR